MPPPIDFNHAMIYTADVPRSLAFYQTHLGFELLEEYRGPTMVFYARLRIPGTNATIALHLLERGKTLTTGGIRLYFEVQELEAFCAGLEKAGVKFTKPPQLMPWGWKHAYLDDPDGHEVSLYWAGEKRLEKAEGTR